MSRTYPANQFSFDIDPSWTLSDIALRLQEIAELIERGNLCGENWALDVEWEIGDPEAED